MRENVFSKERQIPISDLREYRKKHMKKDKDWVWNKETKHVVFTDAGLAILNKTYAVSEEAETTIEPIVVESTPKAAEPKEEEFVARYIGTTQNGHVGKIEFPNTCVDRVQDPDQVLISRGEVDIVMTRKDSKYHFKRFK